MANEKKQKKPAQPITIKTLLSKRNIVLLVLLGIVGFIGFLVWSSTRPVLGGPHYGVCRTIAELQLTYPSTMAVSEAYRFGSTTRVYYTYTNAFGEYKLSVIRCKYLRDPRTKALTLKLESIKLDRMELSPEKVAEYNKLVNVILASKPDLALPRPPGPELQDLKKK